MINPKRFNPDFVVFISLNIEISLDIYLKFLKCRPNLAFFQVGYFYCWFALNYVF